MREPKMPTPTRGPAREVQLIVSLMVALGAPLAHAADPSQRFMDSLNAISQQKKSGGGNDVLGTVARPQGRITNWFMVDGGGQKGQKSSGGGGRIIVAPGGGGGGGIGEPEPTPSPPVSDSGPPPGPVYTG